MKVHLNAPLTSARFAAAGIGGVDDCVFCGCADGDCWSHLSSCDAVLSSCDRLFASGRMPALVNGHSSLMLQTDADGASVAATVAFFASVWRVRASCRLLSVAPSTNELHDLVLRCMDCPWLVRCVPTLDRKARRAGRMREPKPAPGTTVYRSDGAARGQGHTRENHAGWGAAVWLPSADGFGAGAPHASARGYLGEAVSNNIAEYHGLLNCLRRAVRVGDAAAAFQVDSLLVARQMSPTDAWACRSEDLIPLRDSCRDLTRSLSEAHVRWSVQHIYREFNQSADSLANAAVDEKIPFFQTSEW